MSMINLGVTMSEAEKESNTGEFKLIPEDTYKFRIDETQMGTCKNGRPCLKFRTVIAVDPANDPNFQGRIVFHDVPLPWINADGQHDVSGVGLLVSMAKGCGIEWDGTDIDPAQFVGCTFVAKTHNKVRLRGGQPVLVDEDHPEKGNKIDTKIKSIVYE